MITLSLLQFLENNNLGTVDTDLFWQKLSLKDEKGEPAKGIFIVDLGQSANRGERKHLRYELYSRGKNDVEGLARLQEIIDFLDRSFSNCTLPACPLVAGSNSYTNVTIMPLSTPTNVGEDENGRIIWSATGVLIY